MVFGGYEWMSVGVSGTLKYKWEEINNEKHGELREGNHGDTIVSVQWQSQLSHRDTYAQASHDPLAWRRQRSGWWRFVSVLKNMLPGGETISCFCSLPTI